MDLHTITVEVEKHTIEVESLNQTVEVVLPVQTQVVTHVDAIVISGGGSIYRHDQTTVLSTWVINHNLGSKPLAQFFTDGGQEIETEWLNISDNQIQAFFNPARSGYALIKL